jgi:peptidoglycan/xylan/chitin deacetylase (PgdA/CDA1 family)
VSADSVPILMYHEVTPRPITSFRKYSVVPRAFAAQMNWIALAGYTPVTLDALLDSRAGSGVLPKRPIVITFDDGYRDCFEHAVPILAAHRFTAIFFLVAGLMGRTSEWLRSERRIELPLVDWTDARQLEAAGFQCGSHTMWHQHLMRIPSSACRDELAVSKQVIEDQLGREVRHLAYPFGEVDRVVRALADQVGYRSACSTRLGRSALGDDRLALHRVMVSGHDSLLDFVCRLQWAQDARELLRGLAARARGRLRRGTHEW